VNDGNKVAMAPTYYQIDLSGRLLVTLVVVLAGLLVLAFALGYGAAWSTLRPADSVPTPASSALFRTPTPAEELVVPPPTLPAMASVATPVATPEATAIPSLPSTPTPAPTSPAPTRPVATAVPTRPALPTPGPQAAEAFWVQVLATSRRESAEEASRTLDGLGFGPGNRRVVESRVAGGNVLFKVQVGPFPDGASADRVAVRMRSSGFKDAWVVKP